MIETIGRSGSRATTRVDLRRSTRIVIAGLALTAVSGMASGLPGGFERKVLSGLGQLVSEEAWARARTNEIVASASLGADGMLTRASFGWSEGRGEIVLCGADSGEAGLFRDLIRPSDLPGEWTPQHL